MVDSNDGGKKNGEDPKKNGEDPKKNGEDPKKNGEDPKKNNTTMKIIAGIITITGCCISLAMYLVRRA